MKRFLSGSVLLALTAVFSACSSDSGPTQDGTPDHIVATPSIAFVKLGDSTAILLRLVDQQGTSMVDPITISNVQGSINVRADSAFRPIYTTSDSLIFNPNGTEIRVYARGDGLSAGSFDVSSGGKTTTVPVTVMPTEFTPTVSPSPADIATLVTLTAPSGLTFGANTAITDASGNTVAYVFTHSADNTSVDVFPIPGATLTGITASDIHPAYAPSLALKLSGGGNIVLSSTVGAGLSGVDNINTAPEIVTPAGIQAGVIDVGSAYPGATPDGDGARYYKVVVPSDGTYDFSLTWGGGKDLGIYAYDATGASLGAIADDGGLNDGSESATDVALTAGTYYIGVIWFDYGAGTLPDYYQLAVTRH